MIDPSHAKMDFQQQYPQYHLHSDLPQAKNPQIEPDINNWTEDYLWFIAVSKDLGDFVIIFGGFENVLCVVV